MVGKLHNLLITLLLMPHILGVEANVDCHKLAQEF